MVKSLLRRLAGQPILLVVVGLVVAVLVVGGAAMAVSQDFRESVQTAVGGKMQGSAVFTQNAKAGQRFGPMWVTNDCKYVIPDATAPYFSDALDAREAAQSKPGQHLVAIRALKSTNGATVTFSLVCNAYTYTYNSIVN